MTAPATAAPIVTQRDPGPATERAVARDLARRGVLVAPLAVAVGAVAAGAGGAASVAFALAVVVANLYASAALLAWAARVSYALVMAVALFGFLVRLALVGAAVWLVRDHSWVHPLPLGLTLVVGHLGLLFWEARHVSASLAFPGVRPPAPNPQLPQETS